MNTELAELGNLAATETDDSVREELLLQIQEVMEEDSPYVVLLQAGRTLAASDRVSNIVLSSAYVLDFASLTLAE